MRRVLPVIALAILAMPPCAAAQTWRELYVRGEYQKAADLLHPLVMEFQSRDVPFPDVEPTEMLGRLYLEGRGVPQDAVLACSFFDLASRAASVQYHDDGRRALTRLEPLRDEVCGKLSPDARREAVEMMACPRFGLDAQAFTLDADHWVEVSRRGLRVRYKEKEHLEDFANGCGGQVYPLVRYTRVDPRVGAAARGPRHFLEIFNWTASGGGSRRILFWHLVEILGATVNARAGELLRDEPGSRWPHPPVPMELANVSLRMLPDGQVRWSFDATGFGGLVQPLPLEVAPDVPDEFPPTPTVGGGRIDVSVVDHAGASMAGVSVTATGIVTHEGKTGVDGSVTFDDLPDGRYGVFAWAQGFFSPPRVVDVSGGAVPPIVFALKPVRGIGVVDSCGPAAPLTIESFAADADAVLHVRIEAQHAYRRKDRWISTTNEARIMESYKTTDRLQTSSVSFNQASGWIDRGDSIEQFSDSDLPVLNVGDEYVLFLKWYPEYGYFVIHYAEEGAFRIRNGGVTPLGRQDVARAWKGRSAVKFFQALKTRVKR